MNIGTNKFLLSKQTVSDIIQSELVVKKERLSLIQSGSIYPEYPNEQRDIIKLITLLKSYHRREIGKI